VRRGIRTAEVAAAGGLLDEAHHQRLRYLDGIPKESTRWIGTGWTIAACSRSSGRAPTDLFTAGQRRVLLEQARKECMFKPPHDRNRSTTLGSIMLDRAQ
jgi:hypothetical protein